MRYCLPLLIAVLFVACNGDSFSDSSSSAGIGSASTTDFQLFELLPQEQTGIDFENNTFQTHDFNVIDFGYFINGAGVATLDFDQDGLTDVFFVSNQEENRLYRNLGDWQFEDVTESAGLLGFGGFQTGVNVVDINLDGLPDLYIGRTNADDSPEGAAERTNLLFVNTGNGSFREAAAEYGLASDRPTTQAVFFDYDLDGDQDCYLINTPIDYITTHKLRVERVGEEIRRIISPERIEESDQLLRNEGNGRFVDVSTSAGITDRAWGLSAVVYDFNEDGWPDIFVANDYVEPDMLYLNQGDGTFTENVRNFFRHMSHNSMGSDLADVNNDGLLDVLVVDMLSDSNFRRKSLETLMMPDRYNTLLRYGFGHQVMWNVLQINNGNGSYSEIGSMAGISSTDWSWSPLFADFDHDGHIDLHITNGYRYDITNIDYLRYTVDSINRAGGINLESFPTFDDYLAIIPTQKVPNFVYQNKGDLTFADQTINWGMNQPSYSSGSAYADFDNDGDLDLVVNNMHEAAFVYRNRLEEHPQAANRHYLRVKLEGPREAPYGQGASVSIKIGDDYQNTQQLYAGRGFQSASVIRAHFGLGANEEVDELIVEWPDGKSQLLTGVAADQEITISYANARTGPLAASEQQQNVPQFVFPPDQRGLQFFHRENNFYDFNREFLLTRKLSREGPALSVGDVNADGLQDVFFGGARGQIGQLFLQDANGQFRNADNSFLEPHRSSEDVASCFFDADADGDVDIYVVSGGNEEAAEHPSYQDRLYLNNGQGQFSMAPVDRLPELSASGAAVAPFDVDSDGDLDLLVAARGRPGRYPESDRSVLLLNDGLGNFSEATEQWLPGFANLGMLTDLAIVDLDGDAIEEVIVVGDWLPVSIFQRTTSADPFQLRTEGPLSIPNSTGWWNSITIADLNNDQRPDLILGNEGLNSRIHPTDEQPLVLLSADFDQNGSIDPIHAFYEGEQLFPIPNRESVIRQLPDIRKKYPLTTPYASANVYDIFGREAVDAAQRYEVRELHSLIYYNETTGFRRAPLPNSAQTSPIQDAIAQDFNGDNRPDLLLVGNDWGTEVETGRYDAGNGCLLLQDESGEWRVVENRETGFWASLDARRLAVFPLGSGPMAILIANNNATSGCYLWQPTNLESR